jgi:APA family basic amino acid/polyamine antiporter
MPDRKALLGLRSGIGLVVGNMVGAGVFVSAGFMAQDMGPGTILLAWVAGAVIALSGARAYATVAAWVPRSGGEYRFLSDLLHPALGYLAGWASLLLGFSAPLAVDGLAAGSFAATILPGIEPRVFGTICLVVLCALHAFALRSSRWTQNLLVSVDALLLAGFVLVGLLLGRNEWPDWTPPNPSDGFPLEAFMRSLFFIAFAFSGWNAAAYAAEEFEDPRRDVPRAMLIGCGLVAALYLVVNWVFVANLTPERARAVFEYETTRVTLGHLVVRDLIGELGGKAMSLLAMVAFLSAASAMTLVGPRVYAAMARDGFLPRVLAGEAGRPPTGSVILQTALALLLLWTHTLQQVLSNVGAILTLFAALTSFSIFRVRLWRPDLPKPPAVSLAAAAVHVASAGLMLYFGFRGSTHLLLWVGAVAAAALLAYATTRALHGRPPGS